MARLTSALLISCLLVLIAAPNQSTALSHVGSTPRHVQHAQQLAHEKRRMIKVRQNVIPDPLKDASNDGNTKGDTGSTGNSNTGSNSNANGNANANSNAIASTTANTVANTQSASSAAQTQSSSTAAAPTQTNSNPLASILNGGTQSTSTTSSATSTSLSSALTTSATPTTAAVNSVSLNIASPSIDPVPSSQAQAQGLTRTIISQSLVSSSSTATAAAAASNSSASSFGRNSIIAIVVIASCVGGAAAIWTLIRKWKLGTSAKFDERLNPIEWSPEMEANAGAGLPGAMREKDTASVLNEKHKRAGSTGSHGSFHSGDADHSSLGRNVTGNGNMFADQNPSTYAPESHDFTAGPAQTYGATGYEAGAGYVDLQRSHSGSRGADLTRGPSVGPSGYSADYEQGYGAPAGAYGRDAYGGYDAYPRQQQPQYGAGYPQGRY